METFEVPAFEVPAFEVPAFEVRRVVTGMDDGGRSLFVSDGVPAATVGAATGPAVSELLWLGAMPSAPGDGGDPPAGRLGGFPEGGEIACRVIRLPGFPEGTPVDDTWLRMPGDAERPGMHRSETLDLMVVVDGRITLGLDDGEYPMGPGDVVVQRGTMHRWRVVGEDPCTYLSVLLSPQPGAEPALRFDTPGHHDVPPGQPQRIVTVTTGDGASAASSISPATASNGSGTALDDLWQTGGPLVGVEQGGDTREPWSLEPLGAGVAFRRVAFAPGQDPAAAFLHTSDTIDVGIVVSGALELGVRTGEAPGQLESTTLRAGDCIVQRGAVHCWTAVGPDPAVLVTAMIGVQRTR